MPKEKDNNGAIWNGEEWTPIKKNEVPLWNMPDCILDAICYETQYGKD